MQKPVIFGWELILDLYDCNANIAEAETLRHYIELLCEMLHMKRFGPAMVKHFGHNDKRTSGYTVVQLIETSSITGHFSDAYRTAHINIFSCREFDYERVLNFTMDYFDTKTRNYSFHERGM